VEVTPSLEAHAQRFRARLAAVRGRSDEAERAFLRAAALYREIATPWWLALTLLDYADFLADAERVDEAEPVAREAGEIFTRLGATPYVERSSAVLDRRGAVGVAESAAGV
jgi:hypothetical protein